MAGILDYDARKAERRAEARAAARDITVRACANTERRAERLADPLLFLKGYFPKSFFRPYSQDQITAIQTVVDCARYNVDEIICAPRGDWKTETLKHLVVYLMLAEIIRFPVWIAATTASARTSFEHVKKIFANPALAEDFPEVCDPILAIQGSPQKAARQTHKGKLTRLEWKAEHLVFPFIEGSPFGGMKFTYRGLDAHIRGINIEGDRPDFAPCDDLETRESADSDHQIGVRERLLDNDVGGLGSGETIPRVVLGTVQNRKCLTFKKLQEWGGKRFQAVKVWPDSDEAVGLRDEYIEKRREEKRDGSKEFPLSYQFYVDNQEKIEAGLVIGNPYSKSTKLRRDGRPLQVSAFQRVLDQAADKKWAFVNCELQNDPDVDDSMETPGLLASVVRSRIHAGLQGVWPSDADYRVCCIDVGKYGSHWVDVAWTGNAIGRVLDYGVAETYGLNPGSSDTAIELSIKRMLLEWRDLVMAWERPPDLCLIDSGDYTSIVYQFVLEVGGTPFNPSKGWDNNRFRTHKPARDRMVGNQWNISHQPNDNLWLYNVNVDYWKHWVHQRFLTQTYDENHHAQAGTLSLYATADKRRHVSFSQHIVSEEYREQFVRGKGIKKGWFKKSKNNHWLDAIVLACAAGSMLGVSLDPKPEQIRKPKTRKPNVKTRTGRPYLVTERR